MAEEEKKEQSGLSRREFLKDAGFVVGGAAVGSMAFMGSCAKTTTSTVTVTQPPVTTTATVSKFVDPIDSTEWTSLDAVKAHFNIVHPNADASIVNFTVNGTSYAFQVKPYASLATTLREQLGMFSVKEGCNLGECGTCTVLVDGVATFACMMLACEMENRTVLTSEGLSANGKLSPLQQKFYDQELVQCGACTPGFIMAAQGLINVTPKPTLDDVRLALSGHICMCGNLRRTFLGLVGGV